MSLPDYYTLLKVPSNATIAQIKQSYRRLVRLYHPDVNKHTQDSYIKQLNEAYDVLGNSIKRVAYDALRVEEQRAIFILEALRRQQKEATREPKMTWTEGMIGFVREFKKGIQDD